MNSAYGMGGKLYVLQKSVIAILEGREMEGFLVLNGPEFVLFRVEVEDMARKDVEKCLRPG